MDPVTIPGWFVWIVTGLFAVFIPWAVWITQQNFNNDKAIALNTANDMKVGSDLERIYTAMDESNANNQHRFDKLESKLDMFLNQELSFLKQVASNQK